MAYKRCPHCGSMTVKVRPQSVQAFVAARVRKTGIRKDRVQSSVLHQAYAEFCLSRHFDVETATAFGSEMVALEFTKTSIRGLNYYVGIELRGLDANPLEPSSP